MSIEQVEERLRVFHDSEFALVPVLSVDDRSGIVCVEPDFETDLADVGLRGEIACAVPSAVLGCQIF